VQNQGSEGAQGYGAAGTGSAWNVPGKIQIKAQRERDSLTYEFVSEDYSQVIGPRVLRNDCRRKLCCIV